MPLPHQHRDGTFSNADGAIQAYRSALIQHAQNDNPWQLEWLARGWLAAVDQQRREDAKATKRQVFGRLAFLFGA